METVMFDEEPGGVSNLWDNIEADIADLTTFNLLKDQYNSRMRELESSTAEADAVVGGGGESDYVNDLDKLNAGGPVKTGKRNHRKKLAHMKKQGDQLTYQSEQNVLAEIDIYTFLGMVCIRKPIQSFSEN